MSLHIEPREGKLTWDALRSELAKEGVHLESDDIKEVTRILTKQGWSVFQDTEGWRAYHEEHLVASISVTRLIDAANRASGRKSAKDVVNDMLEQHIQ